MVGDYTQLGGEGNPQRIEQKIEIWPYQHVGYAQPRISPGEWDAQTSLGFWDTNRSPNLDSQQKIEPLELWT